MGRVPLGRKKVTCRLQPRAHATLEAYAARAVQRHLRALGRSSDGASPRQKPIGLLLSYLVLHAPEDLWAKAIEDLPTPLTVEESRKRRLAQRRERDRGRKRAEQAHTHRQP